MSLQGTGDGNLYWYGALPALDFASRPLSISLWYQETSSFTNFDSHHLGLIGSSTSAFMIPLVTNGANVQLYDINDDGDGGYIYYNGSNLSIGEWYHLVFVFPSGQPDAIYQNSVAQAVVGSITQVSPQTLDTISFPGCSYHPMNPTALIGEITIWSGALSAA